MGTTKNARYAEEDGRINIQFVLIEESNMMPILRSLSSSLLLLVAVFVGCSTRESPQIIVDPPGPRIMKAALEEIAATGVLGDSAKTIKAELEAMTEDNATRAKALQPDFDQLMSLTDPAAIKAKAKEMAAEL